MSFGVRISNLPDITNNNLRKEFLSKVTTNIEKIIVQENKAQVILYDEEDLDSVLMLDGQEILGYSVRVQNLADPESDEEEENKESDPEILDEDPKEIIQEESKIIIHEPPALAHKENLQITNTEQLRNLLQGISLKPRRALDSNDSFLFILDFKLAALVTMFTLIALVLSDLLA